MKTIEPSARTANALEKAFRSHPISQDQSMRLDSITEKLLQVGRYLCSLTPDSDEQRLMLQKLQEAGFWAKESISKNEG